MKRLGHQLLALGLFVPYAIIISALTFAFNSNQTAFPYLWDITLFLGLFATIFCATLPDRLDPPSDYKHRKTAHSKRLFTKLKYALLASTLVALVFPYAFLLSSGILAYVSHLWADSRTPMGLPP